jgi:hypothetical protein
MNTKKLIYCLFSLIFAGIFNVFAGNSAPSDHNKVNFAQGGVVIKARRPINPNSKFAGSSFSGIGDQVSMPAFSLSKEKSRFSGHSSISKEGSFSSEPSLEPKSGNGGFSGASLFVYEDAEFSDLSTSTPKYSRSEFSITSSMSSRNFLSGQ